MTFSKEQLEYLLNSQAWPDWLEEQIKKRIKEIAYEEEQMASLREIPKAHTGN